MGKGEGVGASATLTALLLPGSLLDTDMLVGVGLHGPESSQPFFVGPLEASDGDADRILIGSKEDAVLPVLEGTNSIVHDRDRLSDPAMATVAFAILAADALAKEVEDGVASKAGVA